MSTRAQGSEGDSLSHTCSHCGAAGAPFSCSRCKSSFYCGASCQKTGWPSHKVHCKRIATAWLRDDETGYGTWAPRVNALLGVRPTFCIMNFCFEDLIFCDPDVPRAEYEPLRLFTTIASPSLSADAARTMLSLANEVRDELRTLNATSSLGCDASSRRELLALQQQTRCHVRQ